MAQVTTDPVEVGARDFRTWQTNLVPRVSHQGTIRVEFEDVNELTYPREAWSERGI